MKLVQVTWVDAVGGDGWLSLKDLEKETPTTHISVGFIVKDTKDYLTITMSYDEQKTNLGAWLCIPKKYIKKVKKL